MLFLMRSLQQLTRLRYSAGLFGLIVTLLVVHVFTRDTEFSNRHFWVRGEDHKVWGAAWIYLFFYWNVCVRGAISDTADKRNRWLLRAYAWGLLNVSFAIALAYAFLALLTPDFAWARSLWRVVGMGVPSDGYNIFQDLPSVWCVFSAVQVLLAPFVLAGLHRGFRLDPRPDIELVPWLERAEIMLKTAALAAVLYFGSPLIREVALRMFVK